VATRLRAAGVAVVALAADDDAARRLREMGAAAVLPRSATAAAVADAVVEVTAQPRPSAPTGTGRREPGPASDDVQVAAPQGDRGRGTVIAVWGPPGSPGRTVLATALAAEFALLGLPTVLVDADVSAASVAQYVGLLDEVPGLAAAARDANRGALDLATLAAHARTVPLHSGAGAAALRVLTGLPRADRWPELQPGAVSRVLERVRELAAMVVVDCSSCVEADEELSYDLAVPRRHGATLTVLAEADRVLAVGSADPVGLTRLIRGLGELASAVPAVTPAVVVNRLRSGPIAGEPGREVRDVLRRFASVTPLALLPEDRRATDHAVAGGKLLAEASPGGPLRLAVRALAAQLAGRPAPVPRRRRRGWPGRPHARRRPTRTLPG
jgi:MinD-like ATPase involved in chromosome partitioning or flagellar assembly